MSDKTSCCDVRERGTLHLRLVHRPTVRWNGLLEPELKKIVLARAAGYRNSISLQWIFDEPRPVWTCINRAQTGRYDDTYSPPFRLVYIASGNNLAFSLNRRNLNTGHEGHVFNRNYTQCYDMYIVGISFCVLQCHSILLTHWQYDIWISRNPSRLAMDSYFIAAQSMTCYSETSNWSLRWKWLLFPIWQQMPVISVYRFPWIEV